MSKINPACASHGPQGFTQGEYRGSGLWPARCKTGFRARQVSREPWRSAESTGNALVSRPPARFYGSECI